jgi:hypothetical protein
MSPERIQLETRLLAMRQHLESILKEGKLAEQIPGKADAETLRKALDEINLLISRIDAPRPDMERTRYTWMITDLWWDRLNDPLGRQLVPELFEIEGLWQKAAKDTRGSWVAQMRRRWPRLFKWA